MSVVCAGIFPGLAFSGEVCFVRLEAEIPPDLLPENREGSRRVQPTIATFPKSDSCLPQPLASTSRIQLSSPELLNP